MSDIVSIVKRAESLEASPQFTNYSKVIIHLDEERIIEVGNDTGRTLEITNPFGNLVMARNILNSLRGYQYQPYEATGALLDPAAEMGDAASFHGAYGGIYIRNREFGRLMMTDISAPNDEELNHEFTYVSPEKREFTRQIDDVRATLAVYDDRIEASVKSTGGNNASFGWKLTTAGHVWYSGGKSVMAITSNGLSVIGKITAKSGEIGGFTIGDKAIYNNLSSFGGSQSSGVYLGTNGIQLGQAFKVTPQGQVTATNITANNMKLTGTLNVGGQNITAEALQKGAASAYSNGGGWSSGAAAGNAAKTMWDYATDAQRGISYLRASTIYCTGTLMAGGIMFAGQTLSMRTVTISGTTIAYVGWGYG